MPELSLREPSADDAPAVLAAVRESLPELSRWMPWCRPSYAIADALAWAGSRREAAETGAAYEYVIEDADGALLGCCGVNSINRESRFANLGYWVRTSRAGRGIATAAARTLADRVFRATDLQRLEIVVAVGNAASLRVAEKLGAIREGTLRCRLLIHGRFHDVVMYALLRPPDPA